MGLSSILDDQLPRFFEIYPLSVSNVAVIELKIPHQALQTKPGPFDVPEMAVLLH
jgi:hypothetical protein